MARLDGCCSKCGDLLTESNWASHKRRNRSYECVTCQRDYELRRRYGIGNDEYQAIFEAQRGLCAICGVHQNEISQALSVDHCHESGKVRGLLCGKCNVGLGQFNDDIEGLEAAITYLKKYG